MMKASPKRLIIFIVGVFALWVGLSISSWVYYTRAIYYQKRLLLEKYINAHREELKEDVFTIIFAEAAECAKIRDETSRRVCSREIGKRLGIVLKEEELVVIDWEWPNDLFFIKNVGDGFLSLGWSGEIKDISSLVNKDLLFSKTPLIFHYLSRKCNFFRIFDDTPYSCETYASLSLSDKETGYLVRITPLDEETDIRMNFLMPFWFLFSLIGM